jgi:hypothetical protein
MGTTCVTSTSLPLQSFQKRVPEIFLSASEYHPCCGVFFPSEQLQTRGFAWGLNFSFQGDGPRFFIFVFPELM